MSYKVNFTESERGWGTDSWVNDYDTEEEARAAVKETNAKNSAEVVPDIYIYATYMGKV